MPQRVVKRNPDIYRFIDFFVRAGEKIRGKKPEVIRGKDGRLVSLALRKLSVSKLETLAVWFLTKKKNLRPLIATMLSRNVLEELERAMNKSSFWKDVEQLMDQYYPRSSLQKLSESDNKHMWQPFTHKDITDIKEHVARDIRKM
jgi:hypothetical protein